MELLGEHEGVKVFISEKRKDKYAPEVFDGFIYLGNKEIGQYHRFRINDSSLKQKGAASLWGFNINPDFKGKHYGTSSLKVLTDYAKRAGCEVFIIKPVDTSDRKDKFIHIGRKLGFKSASHSKYSRQGFRLKRTYSVIYYLSE